MVYLWVSQEAQENEYMETSLPVSFSVPKGVCHIAF